MAVGIRIARVGFFAINKMTGQKVDKNSPSTTINDVLMTEHQHRVIEDLVNAPNSSGNPTVADYLKLEATQDYVVYHMDQTMIVTYDQGALNAAS